MKKIILLIFILMFLPLVLADVCPSTNNIDFSIVPCEAITPVLGNCSTYNVSVISLNNSDINQTQDLINKFDNIYNFSFNYSGAGAYQATLCDNSTATLIVGEFSEFYSRQTYVYIFGFLFGLVFITGGYYFDRTYMIFVGGILFIVLGLLVWINGIQEVDSLLMQRAIFVSTVGIGAYFMTTAYLGGNDNGSSV